MKIRIAIILGLAVGVLFFCSLRGFTAEATAKQSGPLVDPPKLTVLDCQTILSGLNGLDGRIEMTKDAGTVTLSYQFGSATLRLAIQRNLALLQAVQQDFVKSGQAIFKEIAGDAPEIKPNTPEMVLYNKQIMEAQQAPCTAPLTRINVADLKLDKNEIPGTVLAALDKILDK